MGLSFRNYETKTPKFTVKFDLSRGCIHSFFVGTSNFRIKRGPFLFSGQFQPGNVLTDVLKFQ